jgi:HD superfamily phosphohydrolase YqeK
MIEEMTNKYILKFESDDFYENLKSYFLKFNKGTIFQHTEKVVSEIKILADTFKLNKEKTVIGAYLHDVGNVIEKEDAVLFCQVFGEKVWENEKQFPFILHQKSSKVLAEHLFKIKDAEILNAIACHTTLKASPKKIEMAVYLADKLSWEEEEYQELISKMRLASKYSMEEAIFHYQKQLNNKRKSLPYYHTEARKSYRYFEQNIPSMKGREPLERC